jgi:hypothetical protein
MVACLHKFEINKYLREPIIWIFVRVILDFAPLFFSNWTTCKVVFANKSSDKLGESVACLWTSKQQGWNPKIPEHSTTIFVYPARPRRR